MKTSPRSKRPSVILSFFFIGVFLVLLAVLACILPLLIDNLIATRDLIGDRSIITAPIRTLLLILSYAMIAVAVTTVILLICLLCCVLHEQVFTGRAVSVLSVIVWCCFAETILFGVVGIWFQLALIVASAACFLGLCLRITCNVIAEATRYKNENDLTV